MLAKKQDIGQFAIKLVSSEETLKDTKVKANQTKMFDKSFADHTVDLIDKELDPPIIKMVHHKYQVKNQVSQLMPSSRLSILDQIDANELQKQIKINQADNLSTSEEEENKKLEQ